MSSINHVVVIGRLTRDPELRNTTSGKSVADFTLAVDRMPKQDGTKEADFIRVSVWGKTGEACASHLGKGSQVAVDGRIQVRTYQGQDGQNRTSTEIVASNVQFLSPKKNGSDAAEAPADNIDWPEGDLSEEPPF